MNQGIDPEILAFLYACAALVGVGVVAACLAGWIAYKFPRRPQ